MLCGQAVTQPWHVIDHGGSKSTSSGITLQSSIGQPAIEAAASGGTSLESGYIPDVRVLSGAAATLDEQLQQNWNMLSVPFTMNDTRKSILYPTAASPAFAYQGSYVLRDTLPFGIGYWLKYASPTPAHFTGTSVLRESLAVSNGWNMIGCLSYPLLKSSIQAVAPAVISSNCFAYIAGGYRRVDTLFPGLGYWIKVTNDGTLVLQTGSILNVPLAPSIVQSMTTTSPGESRTQGHMNTIVIRDASGNSQTLYFRSFSDKIDPTGYELPPSPPPGGFDVRYATQRTMETADKEKQKVIPILISSSTGPLTILWRSQSPSIGALLIDGKETIIRGDGSIHIQNVPSRLMLRLSPMTVATLPKEYALQQNYPNPFNPTTILRYQIPTESRVILTIYDVLGRVVSTLVDEVQQSDDKSVEWNAGGVAGGTYFYRLEATSTSDPGRTFSSVKKMVLVR
jgi:hypothetical protein